MRVVLAKAHAFEDARIGLGFDDVRTVAYWFPQLIVESPATAHQERK